MKNKSRVVEIILAVIAIIAVIVAILFSRRGIDKPITEVTPSVGPNLVLDTRATSEEGGEQQTNPLAERNVFFAGLMDATVNEDGVVVLRNLPENEDFLMKFTIYNADTEEVIFDTDLVPSGENIFWKPAEQLDAGDYRVSILSQPFASLNGEYVPLTAGSNVINVTVVDI